MSSKTATNTQHYKEMWFVGTEIIHKYCWGSDHKEFDGYTGWKGLIVLH